MTATLPVLAVDEKGSKHTSRPFIEPWIPSSTEFTGVAQVRSVIQQLDIGSFRMPALLVERMLMNPRLRAVVDTRLAGLISTQIRFEPARNTAACRKAAAKLAEDWPLIAAAPMRRQMLKWSLFLGFGLGQRPMTDKTPSGRQILRLRPYWPGFAVWYWQNASYRIITFDRGVVDVDSPAVPREMAPSRESVVYAVSPVLSGAQPPETTPWVVSEPFGVNSFRDGIVHAAWRPWLGHDWAMRDQARASEKHGRGIFKATIPSGKGPEWQAANARFTRALQGDMGAEGVIPCEFNPESGNKWDIAPLEFNGSGFQVIADTMSANATALAILFLGHNLTTEIKGGGSYAAAGVADFIRDDKKNEDAEIEWSYIGPQLVEPWTTLNFGDPSLTPKAVYVTDSTNVGKSQAQMYQALSAAMAQLRQTLPEVDLVALAERFQLPTRVLDKAQIQALGTEGGTPAPPAADSDSGSEPDPTDPEEGAEPDEEEA